ncbi:hypothetical protein, partial [Klebsiella pneumoniae]|uniref:hypothetical protein n=1 Tax=Klebsiella pneumoniae TaxID=573 RepID=UPI001954F0E0
LTLVNSTDQRRTGKCSFGQCKESFSDESGNTTLSALLTHAGHMKSIVITEKPSQARNVQAAVRNSYGTIYP